MSNRWFLSAAVLALVIAGVKYARAHDDVVHWQLAPAHPQGNLGPLLGYLMMAFLVLFFACQVWGWIQDWRNRK